MCKAVSDRLNELRNQIEIIARQEENDSEHLNLQISRQLTKIKEMKTSKADQAKINEKEIMLTDLKKQYKSLTNKDYNPESAPITDPSLIQLAMDIRDQDDIVQNLPRKKPGAEIVTKEVAKLTNLKNDFKKQSGRHWTPAVLFQCIQELNQRVEGDIKLEDLVKPNLKGVEEGQSKIAKNTKNVKGTKNTKKAETKAAVKDEATKTGTRLGLEAKKNENLPEWYSQVITKGEMIEYYDVSGCYILRPWSYSIWDIIKDFFDCEIKKLGVQNCYFPIFVSKSALEREKTHIADFAPEVAWVTKSGESDLAEHIAIRPTSETVMYPAYAKWLKSYRDLPLKLNQWNNVVVCIFFVSR